MTWTRIFFALWTVVIVYSMDVMRPSESALVTGVSGWFAALGLPASLPAQLYHFGSFVVWAVLLTRVVAGDRSEGLPKGRWALCVAAILAFSATVESLQRLNPARSPCLLHGALNAAGGMVGFACGLWYRYYVSAPPSASCLGGRTMSWRR
jgi:hypothetical protein